MNKNKSLSEFKNLIAWCNNNRCGNPIYSYMAFVVVPDITGESEYYCKGHEPKKITDDNEEYEVF